jgi:hypothetical protein
MCRGFKDMRVVTNEFVELDLKGAVTEWWEGAIFAPLPTAQIILLFVQLQSFFPVLLMISTS